MIISGEINEMGMYRLASEETLGTTTIFVSGCRISPKSHGIDARFCVCERPLDKRKSFVCFTRSATNRDDFSSFGEKSFNHKHHLS